MINRPGLIACVFINLHMDLLFFYNEKYKKCFKLWTCQHCFPVSSICLISLVFPMPSAVSWVLAGQDMRWYMFKVIYFFFWIPYWLNLLSYSEFHVYVLLTGYENACWKGNIMTLHRFICLNYTQHARFTHPQKEGTMVFPLQIDIKKALRCSYCAVYMIWLWYWII